MKRTSFIVVCLLAGSVAFAQTGNQQNTSKQSRHKHAKMHSGRSGTMRPNSNGSGNGTGNGNGGRTTTGPKNRTNGNGSRNGGRTTAPHNNGSSGSGSGSSAGGGSAHPPKY